MAIALDTTTDGGVANVSTHTFNHTCTGSNLILFVGFRKLIDDIIAVTYNGVPMTLVTKQQSTGSINDYIYLYVLVAPATGTNVVSISALTAGNIAAMSASYTGAAQTGQPDAFGSQATAGVSSGNANGPTITTVADNCWLVLFSRKTAAGAIAASSGVTLRQHSETTLTRALLDSNGPKTPAGAKAMQSQASDGTQDWNHVAASFAPFTGSPAVSNVPAILSQV